MSENFNKLRSVLLLREDFHNRENAGFDKSDDCAVICKVCGNRVFYKTGSEDTKNKEEEPPQTVT